MVPENIVWAAYSATDYQQRIFMAQAHTKTEPKDVYYQNTNGEWVKVTVVFDCIDKLRKTYNHGDVIYLGAVLANTRGEIERGRKYPPVAEDKKIAEQMRKDQIRERLNKSNPANIRFIPLNEKDVTKDLNSFWTTLDTYTYLPDDFPE